MNLLGEFHVNFYRVNFDLMNQINEFIKFSRINNKMQKSKTDRILTSNLDYRKHPRLNSLKGFKRPPPVTDIFLAPVDIFSSPFPSRHSAQLLKPMPLLSKSEQKFNHLMLKISSMPIESNIQKSDQKFRKSVTNNLKSLDFSKYIDDDEQEEVVNNFTNIVKGKMFTMTKTGIKFRAFNLKKKIHKIKSESKGIKKHLRID